MEFDGKSWSPYEAESSLPTDIIPPQEKVLEGFDVVTFYAKNAPECSPLSCNGIAKEIRTNQHCLLKSFAEILESPHHVFEIMMAGNSRESTMGKMIALGVRAPYEEMDVFELILDMFLGSPKSRRGKANYSS